MTQIYSKFHEQHGIQTLICSIQKLIKRHDQGNEYGSGEGDKRRKGITCLSQFTHKHSNSQLIWLKNFKAMREWANWFQIVVWKSV